MFVAGAHSRHLRQVGRHRHGVLVGGGGDGRGASVAVMGRRVAVPMKPHGHAMNGLCLAARMETWLCGGLGRQQGLGVSGGWSGAAHGQVSSLGMWAARSGRAVASPAGPELVW